MRKGLEVELTALQGPVEVAYRRENDTWYCTALQFDIVGVAQSRDAAFHKMRELVNSYLHYVLDEDGPVEFFNPSEGAEWNSQDKERYQVTAVIAKTKKGAEVPARVESIEALRKLRNRIEAIDLLAIG